MRISKLYRFEAAHMLPRHPGKCRFGHGHSWRLRVDVGGKVNNHTQFVMDYADLDRCVKPLIERWDHQWLNCFIQYPSSENVAAHAAWYLMTETPLALAPYLRVSVSETEKTWAVWDSSEMDSQMRLKSPDAQWRAPVFPPQGEEKCATSAQLDTYISELYEKLFTAVAKQVR